MTAIFLNVPLKPVLSNRFIEDLKKLSNAYRYLTTKPVCSYAAAF